MPLYPTIFPFANFYVVHLSLTILANRSGYVHFRFDDDYEESLRFDQLRTLNQTKLEELGMTFLESTTRNYTREVLWLFPLVYSRE